MRAEAYRIALAKAHGLTTNACTPTDPKPHSNPNPFLNPYLTPTLTLTLTLALALTLILAPALALALPLGAHRLLLAADPRRQARRGGAGEM